MDIQEILNPHEINEGQAKLLSLLKKFDSRCREFGVTYYLGGGTALGAVRHRGFLPWDDDVDLYISRDNYCKLLECKDRFFDDDFVLVSHETYPSYRNVLVRIVDTESTAITRARIADDAPKGQFLELFIMDPIPSDKREKEAWLVKLWVYTELLAFVFTVANERVFEYIDFNLYEKYKKRCEEEGTEVVLKELESELFSIREEDAMEYCSRWGKRNLIYDIDWFREPRYVSFEDTMLPVPSKAERVLRFDYGDSWMIIPNVEEQIIHSIASDMNVSYKYYLDDYLADFNYAELLKAYPKRKEAELNIFKAICESNKKMQELQSAMVELQATHVNVSELKEMLEQGDFNGILDTLSFWYDAQCGEYFWPVREYLNIGDELLKYELTAMLVKGEFSKVLKIINWRKQNDEEVTKEIQVIESYAKLIREAYIMIDENNLNQLRNILLQCNQKKLSVQQYDYKYLKAYCDTYLYDPEGLEGTEQEVRGMLDDYPHRGEIIALLGAIEEIKGNADQAVHYYAEAFENTRNGLVKLQIIDAIRRMREEV